MARRAGRGEIAAARRGLEAWEQAEFGEPYFTDGESATLVSAVAGAIVRYQENKERREASKYPVGFYTGKDYI